MDAHQTQVCIVQQMDAYMGLAYLKTVKKHEKSALPWCPVLKNSGVVQGLLGYSLAA